MVGDKRKTEWRHNFFEIFWVLVIVSKYEILIEDSLGLSFGVSGRPLPDNYHIYKKHETKKIKSVII